MNALRVFSQAMRVLEGRAEILSADFMRWLRELVDRVNFIAPRLGDVRVSTDPGPRLGELEANGADISRTHYVAYFDLVGTTYGVGDGSTTFGLPDYTSAIAGLYFFVRVE
jgi:hypothetical protein